MDQSDMDKENESSSVASNIASDWIVAVASWLWSWIQPLWPIRKNRLQRRQQAVAETLLTELINQMTFKVEREKQTQKEEIIRQRRGIDYSWLQADVSPGPSLISEIERLEFEELFHQVLPEECAEVIRTFRRNLEVRNPSSKDFPAIIYAVVVQVMARHSAKPSLASIWAEWIHSSFCKLIAYGTEQLSHSSVRVTRQASVQESSSVKHYLV